jgi:hypothetical protein
MKRMIMVLTVGTLFLALAAGVALAATYYGNPYAETITGTSKNDDIRGAGGRPPYGRPRQRSGLRRLGRGPRQGQPGGDTLAGGSGSGRVLGGPGNDYVSDTNSGADDATIDYVDCGPGYDTVFKDGRPSEYRYANCESFRLPAG